MVLVSFYKIKIEFRTKNLNLITGLRKREFCRLIVRGFNAIYVRLSEVEVPQRLHKVNIQSLSNYACDPSFLKMTRLCIKKIAKLLKLCESLCNSLCNSTTYLIQVVQKILNIVVIFIILRDCLKDFFASFIVFLF